MKTILYKYYMWRAMRTDDFHLMWHYKHKARKVLR